MRAPRDLAEAVKHPDPATVEQFFQHDPHLVNADHLFVAACRVPDYEGHGGTIDESAKQQELRCLLVDVFVKYGVHVSIRNNRKVSPLHMACRFDLDQVAERLIFHGAEVNAYDVERETPLFRAVNLGYLRCVHVVLQGGADPDFCNRKGMTPLHRCAIRGKREITPILLAAGADATIVDKSGRTPLEYARNPTIKRDLEGAIAPRSAG